MLRTIADTLCHVNGKAALAVASWQQSDPAG
jgi:hypothetical protein